MATSPIARRPARRSSVPEISARSGPIPARLSAATASGNAATSARVRSLRARPARVAARSRQATAAEDVSPPPPSARHALCVEVPLSAAPLGASRATASRHAYTGAVTAS